MFGAREKLGQKQMKRGVNIIFENNGGQNLNLTKKGVKYIRGGVRGGGGTGVQKISKTRRAYINWSI